jgi:ATP-dependent Clp protease adapter protein ClpS
MAEAPRIILAFDTERVIGLARREAVRRHHGMTTEHLMHALLQRPKIRTALEACGARLTELEREISDYLDLLPEDKKAMQEPLPVEVEQVLVAAATHVVSAGEKTIEETHVLAALVGFPTAYATLSLMAQGVGRVEVLRYLSHNTASPADYTVDDQGGGSLAVVLHNDHFTTMAFVTEVLISELNLLPDDAERKMMEVHKAAPARVAVLPAHEACARANRIMRLAEEAGYPLRCTVEPVEKK